jgi:hypothetical protein
LSQKTHIIEQIFNQRWNEQTRTLEQPVVTLEEVAAAITASNNTLPINARPMSTRNPANFFKDFVRNKRLANTNWPRSVLERGYTAKQLTGNNACFEFIPLQGDQSEPFPINRIPGPGLHTPRHTIESVSLGRSDETWLVQVAVRLRIVETHLALFSPRKARVRQVDHLQIGVKQTQAEIDALYLLVEAIDNQQAQYQELIVCCEAKGRRDDILEDQLLRQVESVFRMMGVTQDWVIPFALKAIDRSLMHAVEFEAIARASAATAMLVIASEAVYELQPPVPGVGA